MDDDKKYSPTKAYDENGDYVGQFESLFLARMRGEQEAIWGTTNGNWSFVAVEVENEDGER